MIGTGVRVALLALLWCAGLSGLAAAGECDPRLSTLRAALRAGDLAGGQAQVDAIRSARECGPDDDRSAGRSLSEAMLARAAQLRSQGQAGAADHWVEQAESLNASWVASKGLGDVQLARRDYAAAALTYQQAIEQLSTNETDAAIAGVPKAALANLQHRADEARQLAASEAGQLVSAIPARDGSMGGVYSPLLGRGPEAVRVPVPILFDYNSDKLTPVGQQAAAELVDLLKERAPSTIVVTGHTDHVGSDAFNLALSHKRAVRVAALLKENGVSGTITPVGKGRSEPRVLSEPNSYTPAEIDALNRRVEFDWRP